MSQITTHVLDTSLGKPGRGITVELEQKLKERWQKISSQATNEDGRCSGFLPESTPLQIGIYRLTFHLAAYYAAKGQEAFYPEASLTFQIRDPGQHYHMPLLISGFGFSTYRGS